MTRRRTFLALLGATAVASATNADAADESEERSTESGAAAELDPVEALLAYVEAAYGDRLDEDDRDVVLAGIEGSLDSAAALRKTGLENADEPAYGFSAYRARGDDR